jgi:hypothetical protein
LKKKIDHKKILKPQIQKKLSKTENIANNEIDDKNLWQKKNGNRDGSRLNSMECFNILLFFMRHNEMIINNSIYSK